MAQPAERYPAFTCLDLIGLALCYTPLRLPHLSWLCLDTTLIESIISPWFFFVFFFLNYYFFLPHWRRDRMCQCKFELLAVRHMLTGIFKQILLPGVLLMRMHLGHENRTANKGFAFTVLKDRNSQGGVIWKPWTSFTRCAWRNWIWL